MPATDPLLALRQVSARIGADIRLVQAGGGNTSIKLDGVLWVKASGRWLAAALDEPMFAPVALDGLRSRIAAGDTDPVGPAVRADLNPHGLRPSIETTLHGLLPHAVVLHVHSVDALGWLVRADHDGRISKELSQRLAGLRWLALPYVRPGLPLTQALDAALRTGPIDVVLLGNHGLVVGGASPQQAQALLDDVVQRLALAPRPATAPVQDLSRWQQALAGTPYRLADDPVCHTLALDPDACALARSGALYPDHVVFLGGGLPAVAAPDDPQDLTSPLHVRSDPALLLTGVATLVHQGLDRAGLALLRCLADVALRVPPGAALRTLPDEEVGMLQTWDAEKFRRAQGAG